MTLARYKVIYKEEAMSIVLHGDMICYVIVKEHLPSNSNNEHFHVLPFLDLISVLKTIQEFIMLAVFYRYEKKDIIVQCILKAIQNPHFVLVQGPFIFQLIKIK